MEQFDRIIFYEIIKKDLSLANPLMRSSKKLNKWIHENIELMQMLGLFYQSKLQKQINTHLHRCFNTREDTDINFLYIDNHYDVRRKVVICWNPSPNSMDISESQVCARLENNDSCFESAELIKNKLSILYKNAEKYANRKGDFNSYIDLLNNFNNVMVKFKPIYKPVVVKKSNEVSNEVSNDEASPLTDSDPLWSNYIFSPVSDNILYFFIPLAVYYFLRNYTSSPPLFFQAFCSIVIFLCVTRLYIDLKRYSRFKDYGTI